MEEIQGAGPIFYIKGAVTEDEGPGIHHLCPKLHGVSCETWPTRVWHIQQMEQTEMRMIRRMCMMCRVSLSDGMSSEELRRRVGVDGIGTLLRRHRPRWFGHVERKEDGNWVKRCTNVNCGWGHTRRGRAPCPVTCNCLASMQGTRSSGPLVENGQREGAGPSKIDLTMALKLT